MENKAKFHVTITNNETNEVLHDCDTQVVLASLSGDENSIQCITFTHCDTVTLVSVIDSLETIKRNVLDDNPSLKMAFELKDLLDKLKEAIGGKEDEKESDEQ